MKKEQVQRIVDRAILQSSVMMGDPIAVIDHITSKLKSGLNLNTKYTEDVRAELTRAYLEIADGNNSGVIYLANKIGGRAFKVLKDSDEIPEFLRHMLGIYGVTLTIDPKDLLFVGHLAV